MAANVARSARRKFFTLHKTSSLVNTHHYDGIIPHLGYTNHVTILPNPPLWKIRHSRSLLAFLLKRISSSNGFFDYIRPLASYVWNNLLSIIIWCLLCINIENTSEENETNRNKELTNLTAYHYWNVFHQRCYLSCVWTFHSRTRELGYGRYFIPSLYSSPFCNFSIPPTE